MAQASADFSTSGRDATVHRRRRAVRLRHRRRRRSSTSASMDPTPQEFTPPSTPAASVSQQPPYLPYPDNALDSYVNVAPLPVFRSHSGECPAAHLSRFDRVCLTNGAATPAAAARIFPASLDGDAGLWYDLITASGAEASSPPPPWDAVRAAFLDFFRSPGAADRARAELRALRQSPDETVNWYHLRTLGILRRFPDGGADVPGAFLKTAFVDGLLAEFREWVAPQQPETLDDAVTLALCWERAESVREARRAAKAACGGGGGRCAFCDGEGHEEAQCEVRRKMKELWRSSSSSERGGTIVVAKGGEEAADEGGGSVTLDRLGSAVSTRSARCQCRKHQCWKKMVAASEIAGRSEGNGGALEDKQ